MQRLGLSKFVFFFDIFQSNEKNKIEEHYIYVPLKGQKKIDYSWRIYIYIHN